MLSILLNQSVTSLGLTIRLDSWSESTQGLPVSASPELVLEVWAAMPGHILVILNIFPFNFQLSDDKNHLLVSNFELS